MLAPPVIDGIKIGRPYTVFYCLDKVFCRLHQGIVCLNKFRAFKHHRKPFIGTEFRNLVVILIHLKQKSSGNIQAAVFICGEICKIIGDLVGFILVGYAAAGNPLHVLV